jgi:hypothetical protein
MTSKPFWPAQSLSDQIRPSVPSSEKSGAGVPKSQTGVIVLAIYRDPDQKPHYISPGKRYYPRKILKICYD